MNTHILTFNQLEMPKEVRIGYSFLKVEQDFLAPLNVKNMATTSCREHHVEGVAKTKQNTDYTDEDCPNETKKGKWRSNRRKISYLSKLGKLLTYTCKTTLMQL